MARAIELAQAHVLDAGRPNASRTTQRTARVDLVRRGLSAELGHDPLSLPAALRGRDGLVHGKGRARACLGLCDRCSGYLAVVTETGGITSVSESAGRIWAGPARRYGPSLVLLEHHLAPGSGEGMETLDLVRIGADGSPHWSRVGPTSQENPHHAGLERWMAAYGYQIVGRPASWFDWRDALTGD